MTAFMRQLRTLAETFSLTVLVSYSYSSQLEYSDVVLGHQLVYTVVPSQSRFSVSDHQ